MHLSNRQRAVFDGLIMWAAHWHVAAHRARNTGLTPVPCPSLVGHGVHNSRSAAVFPICSTPPPDGRPTVAYGGAEWPRPAPSAEHAQLREQEINLLCERAMAFDAHGRICLGDCLRHGQRRVE